MLHIKLRNLKKGDRLNQTDLELILGFRRREDPEQYGLELLALSKRIEKFYHDNGSPLFVRQDKYSLKIMTDKEALTYVNSRYQACLRGVIRQNSRYNLIDTKNLSTDEQRVYAENLAKQGYYMAAIRNTAIKLEDRSVETALRSHSKQTRRLSIIC